MEFSLILEDGKYEVKYNDGTIRILRNGVEWRNETGDGFLHALLMSHLDLESELSILKEKQA